MAAGRVSRRRTRIGDGNFEAECDGPASHLPPEIFHHVFAIVACNRKRTTFRTNTLYDAEEGEAKDNLLSCSLVSRAWRLAILPHLFHTVAFYVRHRTFEPSQHECAFGECPCRTIGGFRAVVDARAAVRVNVREVRIGQFHGNKRLSVDPGIDVVELVSLLHHLPNLRVVELQDLTMPDFRLDLWYLPCLFPQRLALDRFSYFAKQDASWAKFALGIFQPLLVTIARIGEMRFSGVAFPDDYIYRRPWAAISLGSLRLLRCSSHEYLLRFFATRLYSWIVPGSLTSVVIDNIDRFNDVQALGRAIRHSGGGIVSLHISTPYWWRSIGLSSDCDLSLEQCLSLDHLKLQFEISCSPSDRCTPEGVCRILSSLRPLTKLRTITLVVAVDGYHGGPGPLPQTFVGPLETELLKLKSLQKVILEMRHVYRGSRAADVFPKLHDKGLV